MLLKQLPRILAIYALMGMSVLAHADQALQELEGYVIDNAQAIVDLGENQQALQRELRQLREEKQQLKATMDKLVTQLDQLTKALEQSTALTKAYADSKASQAEDAAKKHANTKARQAEQTAKKHANTKASQAEDAAKKHANTKARQAEDAAKKHANTKVKHLQRKVGELERKITAVERTNRHLKRKAAEMEKKINASSCEPIIKDAIHWANRGVGRWIEITMLSAHKPNNNWGAYNKGSLYASGRSLVGDIEGFFSDRDHFSKQKKDRAGLKLNINGTAELTLKSWGNKKVYLNLKCSDSFIYSIEDAKQTMHILTLKQMQMQM
ncbi:hypothetical protein PN36_07310 [Candidatus Thiomargarita nelsonii]|uniref:Secreted protein n=1 Tax=Candidatus Thiomargarita nelsonii TaxID=1003181 RepID=A0A0A6PER6_9GAMM|nr:hypothetical protein PN36_07310 [Candidatus Thiomargarita nelsonii]